MTARYDTKGFMPIHLYMDREGDFDQAAASSYEENVESGLYSAWGLGWPMRRTD